MTGAPSEPGGVPQSSILPWEDGVLPTSPGHEISNFRVYNLADIRHADKPLLRPGLFAYCRKCVFHFHRIDKFIVYRSLARRRNSLGLPSGVRCSGYSLSNGMERPLDCTIRQ